MNAELDHIAHGWALLAMRLPEIRKFQCKSEGAMEIVRHYSEAVLYRGRLKSAGASKAAIADYDALITDLEEEAENYFSR